MESPDKLANLSSWSFYLNTMCNIPSSVMSHIMQNYQNLVEYINNCTLLTYIESCKYSDRKNYIIENKIKILEKQIKELVEYNKQK